MIKRIHFSKQPASLAAGIKNENNKIIEKGQKNRINGKEEIYTTTKENEMKKVQDQRQKRC